MEIRWLIIGALSITGFYNRVDCEQLKKTTDKTYHGIPIRAPIDSTQVKTLLRLISSSYKYAVLEISQGNNPEKDSIENANILVIKTCDKIGDRLGIGGYDYFFQKKNKWTLIDSARWAE